MKCCAKPQVFLVLKSIGLICAICFAPAAFAQVRYQITRIPTAQGANSVALGINNKGEVVGYSFQGEDYQAFLYSSSDQSLTDVGSLGGKINAACAINDAGQVTGYSQDGNGNILAYIFSPAQSIASLGTLDSASTSEAFGINSSGTAVGDSQSGTQNHLPVLFSKGSVQDLGIGGSNEPDALETAYAINDAGQIVGRHWSDKNAFHAFVFIDGNTTDLGTLGGANGEALAVNKKGQIVGDSDTTEGPAHAFAFYHSEVKDLGTLPGFDNASYARGINNSGDIVGESDSANQKRAFLYTKGQLIELDKLAENLSEAGFTSLDVAYGISDKGWIVGYGTTTDNLTAAFVALPERRHQRRVSSLQQPHEQPQAEAQPESQTDNSNEENYDLFYSRLTSDEGNWVEAGNYGYCFRPRVSGDWKPYQDGHWVWTDRGWYWDSNERFAWATYHYGRWVDIGGTGWCWAPGDQWAPAWVSWRQSDEEVGWAPLPPEADFSGNGSISSWSDSYYDTGPAAYNFISYSHWNEPSYAQYIEPPQRNVQIISQTRNVTNIVTNNNVINNFGPPVQTVATKTNQNIQQVKLALTPATGPNANYGQTLQGNQLKVVAPPATLKPQATLAPSVQSRIENPQVEKGWQGVKPQDAEKLKKTIAVQNPPPKDLPKPTPFVNSQIRNKGQVTGSSGATGTPGAPGAGSPNPNVIPGASPKAAAAGKKSVPPNLLGAKPSGTPGASPTVKPSGAPGGSPTGPSEKTTTPGSPELKQSPSGNVPAQIAPKGLPPNLLAPRPSPTPGSPQSQRHQAAGVPTPKPTDNLPSGQNTPHAAAIPHNAATPNEEQKPVTAATPALQTRPPNLPTPKPPQEIKPEQRNISTPRSNAVSAPHPQPVAPSNPATENNAITRPKQEPKTPSPQVQPAEVRHTPAAPPAAPKPPPAAPKPPPAAPKPPPAAPKPPPAAPKPPPAAPKPPPAAPKPPPAAPKPPPAAPKPPPAAPKPPPPAPEPPPPAPKPPPPAPKPPPSAPKPPPPAPKPPPAAPKPPPAAPKPPPPAPKPPPPSPKPAPAKGKPTPAP
jgi:probable HAF family extracellular repeat protein